jgi:hypothetical protein
VGSCRDSEPQSAAQVRRPGRSGRRPLRLTRPRADVPRPADGQPRISRSRSSPVPAVPARAASWARGRGPPPCGGSSWRSASPPGRRRVAPSRSPDTPTGLGPACAHRPEPRPSCRCVLRCVPLPDGPARRYSPGAGTDGRRGAWGAENVVSTSEVPANPGQDGGSNSAAAGLAETRRPAPSRSRFTLVIGNAWFDHDQPDGDPNRFGKGASTGGEKYAASVQRPAAPRCELGGDVTGRSFLESRLRGATRYAHIISSDLERRGFVHSSIHDLGSGVRGATGRTAAPC